MPGTEHSSIHHARVANVELDVIEYSEPSEPNWHTWELEEHQTLPGGLVQNRRVPLNHQPQSRDEALAAAAKWVKSREHFELEADGG